MTTSAKAGGGSQRVFDKRKAKVKAKAEADQPDESAEDELPEDEVEEEEKAKKSKSAEDEDDVDAEDEDEKSNATDQRDRIKAILTSDEAKGKAKSAQHLAFNTDLSVEDAKAVLAGLEANKEAKGETPLQKAMAAQDAADIGAEGGRQDPAAGNYGWDGIVKATNARFGRKA